MGFLKAIFRLNVLFTIAVVLFVLWLGGVLGFLYIWLPNYVKGETVTIPDLRGLTAREARLRVAELGVRIDYAATEERFDPIVPRGRIIAHMPGPRQRVKKTRPLRFTISMGPEVVRVPDLRGKSLREADFELSIAGLRVGTRSFAYSDTVPRAMEIIASSPEPGVGLPRGSSVDLLVSKGPRPVQFPMPTLVGLTLEEARRVLEQYHLYVGKISYRLNARARPREVLSQSPGADTIVTSGDRVRLTVNERGGRNRQEPRTVIVRHTPSGSRGEDVAVKIVVQDATGKHVLVNGLMPAGRPISIPRSVVGEAWLIVYERDMAKPVREEKLP